jgi:hypothetical protein
MDKVVEGHFSPGIDLLRNNLAKRLGEAGCQIKFDELIITNGCLEALSICWLTRTLLAQQIYKSQQWINAFFPPLLRASAIAPALLYLDTSMYQSVAISLNLSIFSLSKDTPRLK